MTKNQVYEAWVFKKFTELSGLLVDQPFEQPNPPSPDIVIVGKPTIGIEITSLSPLNSSAVEKEVAEQALTRLLQRTYRARGGPPLWIAIRFQLTPFSLAKRDYPSFVDELLEFTYTINPDDVGDTPSTRHWNLPERLRHIVADVRVRRLKQTMQSHATAPSGGFILNNSAEQMQAEIDRKEACHYQLSPGPVELWLLLYIDPQHAARWTDPTEALAATYKSQQFSRAFILHDMVKKVDELRLSRRAPDS